MSPSRRPRTLLRMAVASLAIAMSLVFAAAAQAARDAFERTVVAGWGAADAGGAWDLEGPSSAFAVDGGMGRLLLAGPRSNLSAMLSGAVTDTDLAATVSVDRPLVGGAVWVYLEARRVGLTSYRLTARLAPDGGGVSIGASRVLDGVETGIGSRVVVPGLDARAGFRLRGQATGTNPTVLRVRAWSGTEPTDWALRRRRRHRRAAAARRQRPARLPSSRSTIAPVIANVDDSSRTRPVRRRLRPVRRRRGARRRGRHRLRQLGRRGHRHAARRHPGDGLRARRQRVPQRHRGRVRRLLRADLGPAPRAHPAGGRQPRVQHGHARRPYFDYFGAAAGDPAKGYYSYDARRLARRRAELELRRSSSCAADSAQVQWLRADLAAHPATCTVALFHHPRFSSGDQHGDTPSVAPFWDALYEYRADSC